MKLKLSSFLPLIGILLFAFIIWSIGLEELIIVFQSVEWFWFLPLILFSFIGIIFKTIKWQAFIKVLGEKYSFKQALGVWFAGFFIGVVTPGKIGEAVRAAYLKKDLKLETGKGLITVALDRIFDVVFLFLIVLLGLIAFSFYVDFPQTIVVTLIILFITLLAVLVILSKQSLVTFFFKPLYRFVPKKFKPKISKTYNDFYSGFRLIRKKKIVLLKASVLTIIAWFVTFLAFYFAFLMLNIDISIALVLMIVPTIILLEALPISFSGIGTRDAGLIFFFSFLGITAQLAVAYSLIILFSEVLFAFIGFLYFSFFKVSFAKKL
ncbi:MAG: lysylphosphatidylglycerol synthase transmembrane domain-containing protein [archaeon]